MTGAEKRAMPDNASSQSKKRKVRFLTGCERTCIFMQQDLEKNQPAL